MQIKELVAALGISHTTLGKWIKEFGGYFSEAAKQRNRQFGESDLDILATIAQLSNSGMNYEAIRKRLADEYRVKFEALTITTDSPLINATVAQGAIDNTKLQAELTYTKHALDVALSQLQDERERTESLNAEIKKLQREIGRLEGRLEEIDKRAD